MNGSSDKKLKNLLSTVPPGALVDSKWFKRHNIADSTYHDYAKRGWLVRLARGVFLRPDPAFDPHQPLKWTTVVASMHQIMAIPFHVGGMSALNLHGLGHYIPMQGPAHINVYAPKLPGWLAKLNTDARLNHRRLSLFSDPDLGVEPLKSAGLSFGMAASFPVATPERAILEAIDELPEGAGFEQLDLVFQGLVNLSPRKLTRLLRDCQRVKVVRLFFVFADRHGHAWLKHLDQTGLKFGHGDRQVVVKGKIHPRYRITVPSQWVVQDKDKNEDDADA